ncbi:conserved hypothetical protein [Gammaproteobacteria bacterium]
MNNPMRYLIVSVLVFITTCCFAIDQKLIDGAKQYSSALNNLKKVESLIKTKAETLKAWLKDLDEEKNKTGAFRSDDMLEFYKLRSEETKNEINNLSIQYEQTKEIIKKLEPIKIKYNKQTEKEYKRKKFRESVLNALGILGIPLTGFLVWLCFFRWLINKNKKYQQMLKEDKITQEEYDRIMSSCHDYKSTLNNDLGINPSTGLPITGIGISDVGGNVRGSSPISSSFDYSQDYSSRHRWD